MIRSMLLVGVDRMVSVTLHYSGGRMAQLNMAIDCTLDNVAQVFGSKGSLRVCSRAMFVSS